MAYMSQEKKAKIAVALKAIMPKDWKYSLAVRHHSTIVMTIKSAPVALIEGTHCDVNIYYLDRQFEGNTLALFEKIKSALNIDNFDESDSMSDYFHVGHYVDLNIGRWDKAFKNTAPWANVTPEQLAAHESEFERGC